MKKSVVVYIHLAFWVVLIATYIVSPILGTYFSAEDYAIVSVYLRVLHPVFFYVGYLFVMNIRIKKKNLLYLFLGVAATYLLLFLISKKAFAFGLAPLSSFYLWTTIGCLFRFFIDWFKKKNDLLVLEKENVSSNLALLKTQINPHFLFNTLHNIDALIHDDQDKASQSLLKLSDIMRYMLQDAKTDFVGLQNELQYLENYFALESLRVKNKDFFHYSITGDCEGLTIAPMLLIPFIENAFKHSVDSNIENGILAKIDVKNKKLFFYCENQYDPSETDKDKTQGIGLETVQKRLNLMYKNKHTLTINKADSVFKVNLELELNEN
ncbi:MAG: sensor histidine kinase [Mariniphaga sp.]